MSNRVVYVLELQDKYSRIAEKINRANAKMKASMEKVQNQSVKASAIIKTSFSSAATRMRAVSLSMGASLGVMGANIKALSATAISGGKNMALFATLPIAMMGHHLIKSAMDAEEANQKFDVVFSSVKNKADSMRENLVKNYAQSRKGATEMLANTADILTGFGFSGDAALDLSNKVQQLAIDLGSFANVDAERASQALTKALLGERESIKSLGIAILESDVKAKVKALAATGALRGMTMRQAKAYATLEIAIGQSKNAIGDKARSMQSAANQTAKMKSRLDDLSVTLGTKLLPLQLKITSAVIKFVDWMESMDDSTQTTILVIAGLVAVLGPLLILLGVIGTVAGFIATGFMLLISPIGLVVLGIAAIVAGAWMLYNSWNEIWDGIVDRIGAAVEEFLFFKANLKEGVQIAARFLGFGDDGPEDVTQTLKSKMEVSGGLAASAGAHDKLDVTINAPEGVVQKVKSSGRSRTRKRLNVGVNNLAPA